MGDVVNLNAYRKKQEREALKNKASENRARHGRKRADRRKSLAEQDRSTAQLDAKKLERGVSEDPDEPQRGA